VLSTEGKVYTWPTRKSHIPTEITPPSQIIKTISAGTQFACLLTNSGIIYSFGENAHGELGVGDTI